MLVSLRLKIQLMKNRKEISFAPIKIKFNRGNRFFRYFFQLLRLKEDEKKEEEENNRDFIIICLHKTESPKRFEQIIDRNKPT